MSTRTVLAARAGRHRTLAAVLLTAVASAALTGCTVLHAGTVTGKKYTPAHETTTMICSFYGKYGCQIWVPDTEEVPARWSLEIKSGETTGEVDVDEHTYDSTKVGDHWSDPDRPVFD